MRIDLCVAASLMLASGAALALDDTPTQAVFQPRLEEVRAPLRQRGDAVATPAPPLAVRHGGDERRAARSALPAERAAPPPWHGERLRSVAEKTSRHLP